MMLNQLCKHILTDVKRTYIDLKTTSSLIVSKYMCFFSLCLFSRFLVCKNRFSITNYVDSTPGSRLYVPLQGFYMHLTTSQKGMRSDVFKIFHQGNLKYMF